MVRDVWVPRQSESNAVPEGPISWGASTDTVCGGWGHLVLAGGTCRARWLWLGS